VIFLQTPHFFFSSIDGEVTTTIELPLSLFISKVLKKSQMSSFIFICVFIFEIKKGGDAVHRSLFKIVLI